MLLVVWHLPAVLFIGKFLKIEKWADLVTSFTWYSPALHVFSSKKVKGVLV